MSASKGPDWHNASEIEKMHMLAACAEGDIEAVQAHLQNGVLVGEFDDDGVTALQMSAARGHTKLTEFLLSLDADVECCNVVGFTPLLHACREGHLEVVKLLLQRGAKHDVTTFTGASALTLASAGGHFELVKYLLTLKNLDVNPRTSDVSPSPLLAASFKNQPVIASFLVANNARVDYIMPQFSLDILSCVVMCSSATMFATLLDLGAKPEAIRNYKNSNIEDLVNICGRVDIWRVLQDYKKKTQINYPLTVNDIRQVIFDGELAKLEDLLDGNTDWTKLPDGTTPLMFAVLFGNTGAFRKIVDSSRAGKRQSMLDAKESKAGLTALMMAGILQDNEMIVMLLQAGANPLIKCDIEGPTSWTAIDFAYQSGGVSGKTLALMNRQCHHPKLVPQRLEEPVSSSPSLNLLSRHTLNKFQISFRQLMGFAPSDAVVVTSVRDDFRDAVQTSHIDWARLPELFVTAKDMLAGSKPPNIRAANFDDYVHMIRNVAHCWVHNGDFAKPFPLGVPFGGNYQNLTALHWPHQRNQRGSHLSMAQTNYASFGGDATYDSKYSTSTNSLVSAASEPGGHVRKGLAVGNHLRLPTNFASHAILANFQPPPSPSTRSLVEPRVSHLRSASSQSHQREFGGSSPGQILSGSIGVAGTYQRLANEFSQSPRVRLKRPPKIQDSDDDIEQMLKSINLQKYARFFKNQEVDLQTFLRCDSNDVRQITEASDEEDVAAIMRLIAEMRQLHWSREDLNRK